MHHSIKNQLGLFMAEKLSEKDIENIRGIIDAYEEDRLILKEQKNML